MPWLKALFATGETLFDRILCVGGAVTVSQAPEFIQQYLQRLGGRLDEARRQLAEFEEVARKAGLTLEQLASRASANSDSALAGLGKVVSENEQRVAYLTAAESSLRDASPFSRPFEFIHHYDPEIARSTWSIFRPAVPATLEGVIYAAVGLVVFLSLYHGLVRYPCRRVWTKLARRRESQVVQPA
jgi:hypothetical protein